MIAPPLRAFAALLAPVVIVAGGVGWLDLLSRVEVLDLGPLAPGALPLYRLAGGEAQPLARVLLAWIGAGLVMGALLASIRRLGRLARAGLAALIGGVTLVAIGAVQDAVTTSEPLRRHVVAQLSHEGLWVAVAVLSACALIPARPAERAAAAAGAMRRDADAGGANGHTPRPA
jgi:hypothetical protein